MIDSLSVIAFWGASSLRCIENTLRFIGKRKTVAAEGISFKLYH